MREAILVTKHQNRPRRRSIPSRASDLLVVAFDTAGQSRVNYGANVRLVHAHPERNRRHDHLEFPIQEIGLHRLPRLPVEPRMIRRCGKVLLQLKRERLRVSPPGSVNNRRPPSLSLEQLARELKASVRLDPHHFDRDVLPPEAMNQMLRSRETQLLRDVALHHRSRRRRQRNHRSGPQRRQMLPDGAVVRTEIVPPLRNAMRFVNRHQAWLPPREHLGKLPRSQPFWSDKQEIQFPSQILKTSLARSPPVAIGMNPLSRES